MNPMGQLLHRPQNNMMGMLRAIAGDNPQAAFNSMMSNNPQFAQFVRENQGRTPEQIAQAYGVDFNEVRQLIGGSTR